jgi:2-polyprenyl-3-methyl-5-hydroxy-6-metoxy-1,4-benzoquinol methylase
MGAQKISFEALPRPLKRIIKMFVPKKIVNFRRNHIQKSLANRSNSEIFTATYTNYRWGRNQRSFELYSGDGSHSAEIIDGYISKVSKFLSSFEELPIVIDIGCGDFNIGKEICGFASIYIACDVVPVVIESNRKKYNLKNVRFEVLDAVNEEIPSGDVVILRQVLQHLSNQDIHKILNKIETKYRYLIFTDHQPLTLDWQPNIDKKTGSNIRNEFGSGLDITKVPFNFKVQNSELLHSVKIEDGYIRTYLFKLI